MVQLNESISWSLLMTRSINEEIVTKGLVFKEDVKMEGMVPADGIILPINEGTIETRRM